MRVRHRWGVALALLVLSLSGEARSGTIDPFYAGSYTIDDIGAPLGLPAPFGGLTFLAGDLNTLLIGGDANNPSGAIYSVGLLRDAGNHIIGFSGPATLYATAPNIDGGLHYGPGGVLFYTAYPTNELGQIKPGSSAPDKVIDLTSLGITSSVGASGFDPDGNFKIVSYSSSEWYSATLTPDGLGTYDVTDVVLETAITGGPEGFIYVPTGSPLFPSPAMLVSEWGFGLVGAYDVDASNNPILSTRRDFVLDIPGAEGALIDPLTGDFLFSTFGSGSGDHIEVVRGFSAPGAVPEPGSLALLGAGAASLLGYGWRRRKAACN